MTQVGSPGWLTVMNLVRPITPLYWGPVALWFNFTRGRERGGRGIKALM